MSSKAVIASVLVFSWGILIGFSLSMFLAAEGPEISTPLTLSNTNNEPRTIVVPVPVNFTNLSSASITVPAVNQDGKGVATVLTVQLIPGSGRSLANIDNIFFLLDTQNSIRTARQVAEGITGVSLKNFDTVYTITADASVIEGPSAGAAISIATIAAIQNKDPSPDVMITGTVTEDGSIGQVGGILEKASAAKEIGAEVFLVPEGQGSSVTYETKKYCEQVGKNEVCTVEQVPVKTDISAEAGIEIVEVSTVREAMEYFF